MEYGNDSFLSEKNYSLVSEERGGGLDLGGSRFHFLTFYPLTSACKFSMLVSTHFLWLWQGEIFNVHYLAIISDHCQYRSKCAPTPPLTQQQSTDNDLGFMLGLGRGRCTVSDYFGSLPVSEQVSTYPLTQQRLTQGWCWVWGGVGAQLLRYWLWAVLYFSLKSFMFDSALMLLGETRCLSSKGLRG